MAEPLRSRRFEPLIRVADQRQQEAVQAFAARQEELAAQELKLAELQAWWQEYAASLGQGAATGTGLLRDARLFLGQLNEAIARQRTAVEQARGALESARARWLALRMDHEALQKVVGRFREDEAQAQRRSEQHEQDEFASRGQRPVQA